MPQPPTRKSDEYDPWTNVRGTEREPLIFAKRESELNPQPVKKFDKRIVWFYLFVVGIPLVIGCGIYLALIHRTIIGKWTDANVDNKILDASQTSKVETYEFKRDGSGTLTITAITLPTTTTAFTYNYSDNRLAILATKNVDFDTNFTVDDAHLSLPEPQYFEATIPMTGQILILRKSGPNGSADANDTGHYFRKL